jgi:hypothetical protein
LYVIKIWSLTCSPSLIYHGMGALRKPIAGHMRVKVALRNPIAGHMWVKGALRKPIAGHMWVKGALRKPIAGHMWVKGALRKPIAGHMWAKGALRNPIAGHMRVKGALRNPIAGHMRVKRAGLYNATKSLTFASYFCKMRVKIPYWNPNGELIFLEHFHSLTDTFFQFKFRLWFSGFLPWGSKYHMTPDIKV